MTRRLQSPSGAGTSARALRRRVDSSPRPAAPPPAMPRRARTRESLWTTRLRRAAPYAGGALIVLVLLHTLFGPYGYFSMRRSQQQIEQVRQEIDRLDHENAQLSGEIRALQSDPSEIEKVAREDMGLARPGELIFRLPDDAPPATPAPSNPSSAAPAGSKQPR